MKFSHFHACPLALRQTLHMEIGMVHLHNVLRWLILILLLASIFSSYSGWQKSKTLTAGTAKLWLFTMISAHVNLLVGLYLVIGGRLGITKGVPDGLMQNDLYRFFWIEHTILMLVAIILITIGRGQVKKAIPDVTKFKKAFWMFFIAFLLILAAIPWPFRKIARPLFPGMSIESTK